MDSSNGRTVIGVFDDYRAAEAAAQDLKNAGIERQAIQIKSNFMTGAAGRSTDVGERHEGGISGFFHRLFGGESDDYSGHYAEAVRRGNAVVCVTTSETDVDRIVKILNTAGAVDIDRHVERYRETGYERHDPKAPAYSYDEATSERDRFRDQGGSVPVVEEELQVGKRPVQRGGVRVHSRVVEKPVEEAIELREEHVRVERRPTDRPVNAGDQLRDQTIEVTETAEEPVVQKRARVREEVVVGKETTSRTEKIRDTVRHTEVEVEKLDAENTSDFRKDWESRYRSPGGLYDEYRPAYEYGYRSASDPRYQGRSWSDVEGDLRTDYMRANPNSSWDRAKDAIRYGWDKVTRKH